jgi:hypothetical protein
MVPMLGQDEILSLLDALNQSRTVSCKASLDEDLSLAFQEAIFSQWGDGVEEVEEALSSGRLTNRSTSATFSIVPKQGSLGRLFRFGSGEIRGTPPFGANGGSTKQILGIGKSGWPQH